MLALIPCPFIILSLFYSINSSRHLLYGLFIFESLLTYFQGDSYLKNRGALGFLQLLSSSQVLRLCGSQGELISDLQERQMLVTVTCKQGNIYRAPTGDE